MAVERNTSLGDTLQTFIDAYLNILQRGSTGYTLQSFEKTTFAGEPANKAVWQATVPKKLSNFMQCTIMTLALILGWL